MRNAGYTDVERGERGSTEAVSYTHLAAPNDHGRAVDGCNVGQCFGHGRSHAGSTGTAAERFAGNLAV